MFPISLSNFTFSWGDPGWAPAPIPVIGSCWPLGQGQSKHSRMAWRAHGDPEAVLGSGTNLDPSLALGLDREGARRWPLGIQGRKNLRAEPRWVSAAPEAGASSLVRLGCNSKLCPASLHFFTGSPSTPPPTAQCCQLLQCLPEVAHPDLIPHPTRHTPKHTLCCPTEALLLQADDDKWDQSAWLKALSSMTAALLLALCSCPSSCR